jgi:hypothetical protein
MDLYHRRQLAYEQIDKWLAAREGQDIDIEHVAFENRSLGLGLNVWCKLFEEYQKKGLLTIKERIAHVKKAKSEEEEEEFDWAMEETKCT